LRKIEGKINVGDSTHTSQYSTGAQVKKFLKASSFQTGINIDAISSSSTFQANSG
jgi:hypothetical protein